MTTSRNYPCGQQPADDHDPVGITGPWAATGATIGLRNPDRFRHFLALITSPSECPWGHKALAIIWATTGISGWPTTPAI